MGTENMQRLTLQRSVTILWYKKRDIADLLIRQYKKEHVAFMAADASWEGRGCPVAPYFFKAEDAAWGGQYGGGCAPGGRVGSGGGWVFGLLLVGVSGSI